MKPILLLGAGRMGGALIEGWLRAGAFAPSEIMVRDPAAPAIARVRMDPPDAVLAEAKTVVLAVKPQVWREAAQAASMIDAAVEAADRFYPAFDFLVSGGKSPEQSLAACMFETVGRA